MRIDMHRTWSLKSRLVWPLMVIVLVIAAIQMGLVYHAMLQEADEAFDAQLKQTARALVLTTPTQTAVPMVSDSGQADELELLIRERGPQGELRSTHQDVFPSRPPVGFSEINTRLGRLRIFTARVEEHDVTVGQQMSARRELAREIALSTLWPLLILAAVSLGLVLLLVRSVLRPVKQLERQVDNRDLNALTPLIDPGLPQELSPLLSATNSLVLRLSKMLDHQKRFLADAAHELRTPISAIGLQNALVTRADNEEERHAALETQRAGIRRASVLIDQLLCLSRLGAEAPLRITSFDVMTELRRSLAMHAHAAEEKQIRMELSGAEIPVAADAELFATVFGNLVGNAVHHCPQGSMVIIHASRNGRGPVVTIDDNGPGIPEHDMGAMLQPFQRNAEVGTSGTGLGLAIVQAACERAGWMLTLDRSELGGLGITVQLWAGRS